ncbi:unnamed protein product [Cercospora beticola]|nr:unnamed protein product [Cercospora beticola]
MTAATTDTSCRRLLATSRGRGSTVGRAAVRSRDMWLLKAGQTSMAQRIAADINTSIGFIMTTRASRCFASALSSVLAPTDTAATDDAMEASQQVVTTQAARRRDRYSQ